MRDRVKLPPDNDYADAVLRPRFERCYPIYFNQILQVHRAWILMLERQAILERPKALRILDGLEKLAEIGPAAILPFDPAKEEVYLHVETALGKIIDPELAGNVSVARTRPEPIARMVSRDKLMALLEVLADLRATLLHLAGLHAGTLMPGYTHLQHAQPTTFGHYLMAVHDSLARDWRRLHAALETVNRDTLGSGALAGTSLPIDRPLVSAYLGFDGMVENTYDCVASTDYMSEPAAAISVMHNTISRVAAQFIVWHTSEFGLIEVSDGHASISSMMPQKKNPSPLEYLRMRSALISGHLMSILGTAHNTTYEDVLDVYADAGPVLWESLELSAASLRLLTGVLSKLKVNEAAMAASVRNSFSTATELAEMIVLRAGVDYRTAHGVVARAVGAAVERGERKLSTTAAELSDLVAEVAQSRTSFEEAWVTQALDPWDFVKRHDGAGGPAPASVIRMAQDRATALARDRALIIVAKDRIASGRAAMAQAADALRA